MWRTLPTAWIHFLWVECFHIYLAIGAWYRLMVSINTKVFLLEHDITIGPIENYFSQLYFLGYAAGRNVTFNDGEELMIPDRWARGTDGPWMILAWMLPLAGAVLFIFAFLGFAMQRVWSFEEGAYISFTMGLRRTRPYQICVALMAISPVLLPMVWFYQALAWTEGDELRNNFKVLQGSTLNGILLLFALNRLAYPPRGCHRWQGSDEFMNFTFQRSFMSLLFGTNAGFVMKLMDALWTAQHGDMSRLQRYVPEPSQAQILFDFCHQLQQAESAARAELHPVGHSSEGCADQGADSDTAGNPNASEVGHNPRDVE